MIFSHSFVAISVDQPNCESIDDAVVGRTDTQISDCFKKWYCPINKDSMIRCEPCYNNPAIVSMYRNNRRIPQITKECGARNRPDSRKAHITTLYHEKSVEAARRNPILASLSIEQNPIARMVSKANLEKANEMGAYALTIFTDAKRLTLSANSWPAREVTAKIGRKFNINDSDQNLTDVRQINLQ